MWSDTSARIAALLPDGGSAVNLGAGDGRVLVGVRALRPNATLHGVDLDPTMRQMAEHNIQKAHIQYHTASSTDLHMFPNASQDVVSGEVFFHHLSTPDQERTRDEVQRILKPEGAFLLTDFSTPAGKIASLLMRAYHALLKEPQAKRQLQGGLHEILEPIRRHGTVEDLDRYLGTIHTYLCRFVPDEAK